MPRKNTSRAGRAGGGRALYPALLACLLAALPGAVAAHQQGVSYSDVTVESGRVGYDLTISNHDLRELDTDQDQVISSDEVFAQYAALERHFTRAIAIEVGGVRCPLALEDFVLDPTGGVVFRLRGSCPEGAPLRVGFTMLALGAVDGYNLAKIHYRGGLTEHVFTRTDTQVVLAAPGGIAETLRRFFFLGVEHIATGYDHMLFLIALLLVGGGVRALVGVVTAFTLAHSLTLALATLEIVTLPTRLVESAIALSIAWVALENLVIDRPHGRWRITFAFGLVHGFGFASVLRAMSLPTSGLAASLVAFNLGVEAGQLAVVLVAFPVLAALQHARRRQAAVRLASGLILVLALYWFVERAFAG